MSVRTMQGADGGSLPFAQPVAGSIAGSPFTVSTTSVSVGELKVPGIMIYSTQVVHIKFSDDDSDAALTHMPIPSGQHVFIPVKSGQYLNVIRNTVDALVYIEAVAQLDD